MKKGKFQNKAHASGMKRSVLILLCLVMLGATVGATIAYLQAQTSGVVNTFIPGEVKVEIHEEFENRATKTNVTVHNPIVPSDPSDPSDPSTSRTVPAYIRAAIVVNWADAQGNILAKPVGNDYTIEYGTDWKLGSDGFYYYLKGAVDPGESTTALIKVAEQINPAPVPGYFLCIDILASGVQSMPDDAVLELWGTAKGGSVTGVSNGLLTIQP